MTSPRKLNVSSDSLTQSDSSSDRVLARTFVIFGNVKVMMIPSLSRMTEQALVNSVFLQ